MNKKQQYITRQVMSSNSYEVFHFRDSYINEISLHHHDFYEVYFFVSGNVRYFIEGTIYSLSPGDIVIISPAELHQPIIEDTTKPYERIVLWISKELVSSLSTKNTNLASCFDNYKHQGNNLMRTTLEVQQNFKLVLSKLLDSTGFDGFGSDLLYKTFLCEALLMLNHLYLEKRDKHLKESGSPKSSSDIKNTALIQSILAYIEEHIEFDITLDELAREFFLTKFYLTRIFKKHTGTTIHKYIVKKKLIFTKELILSGSTAIDAYKKAGFGDYSNFLKAFKVEYGTTPSMWLKSFKKP